jgi:hypothetical protein
MPEPERRESVNFTDGGASFRHSCRILKFNNVAEWCRRTELFSSGLTSLGRDHKLKASAGHKDVKKNLSVDSEFIGGESTYLPGDFIN